MKIETSQAGSSSEHGFTLLELLVVLAIIGLLATSIPGFLLRDDKNFDLNRFTRRVAEGLNYTQTAAITNNRDKVFTIDAEHRQLLVADAKMPLQLPEDIELYFFTAREAQVGQSAGQIQFFPDGSSTGGRISLNLNGLTSMIEVDWLTGLVSISDDAG